MRIIIGTKNEQFDIRGVEWIITDTGDLRIHKDDDIVVIEEVQDERKDI